LRTLAVEHLEEHLGVAAGHVGVRLALGEGVAEVAPAVDHLIRRASADPQLKPATGDEVCRPGVILSYGLSLLGGTIPFNRRYTAI
jgi:hypothetical protein